jgi:hypothetical protein
MGSLLDWLHFPTSFLQIDQQPAVCCPPIDSSPLSLSLSLSLSLPLSSDSYILRSFQGYLHPIQRIKPSRGEVKERDRERKTEETYIMEKLSIHHFKKEKKKKVPRARERRRGDTLHIWMGSKGSSSQSDM